MVGTGILILHGVVMEADEPLQDEDGEESENRPESDGPQDRIEFMPSFTGHQHGIGQQMEDRHSDHDAGHETEGQLHAPVREAQHQWQQSAEHGRDEDKEQG